MTITIGIDVSKTFLDIFDSHNKQHKRFSNTKEGVKKLLAFYKKEEIPSCHMILESTGVYQRLVQRTAARFGMIVYVVKPLRVRQFARSTGQLAKNDKLDAKVLSLFGEKVDLRCVFPRSTEVWKLADLVRLRHHLVEQRRAYKNHLETQDDKWIHQLSAPILKVLETQLKVCEKQIDTLIQEDQELKEKQKLLLTAPGVGKVTSWHILAFLPELGQASREEIASLVGVAPMVCESGNYRGKAMIQGGRSWVREALYMSILSSIRYSNKIGQIYERLKSKGKASKVAMVACMRKLLIILNVMIKNNQAWRHNNP